MVPGARVTPSAGLYTCTWRLQETSLTLLSYTITRSPARVWLATSTKALSPTASEQGEGTLYATAWLMPLMMSGVRASKLSSLSAL